MTDKHELIALAERVEGLTARSAETDAMILAAIWPDKWEELRIEAGSPSGAPADIMSKGALSFVRYRREYWFTGSLDAAMTLVLEGYDWAVFHTNGGLTIHAWCGSRDDVFGSTPALALTAAGLRARHAMGGCHDH